jgi:hypothetical protein
MAVEVREQLPARGDIGADLRATDRIVCSCRATAEDLPDRTQVM